MTPEDELGVEFVQDSWRLPRGITSWHSMAKLVAGLSVIAPGGDPGTDTHTAPDSLFVHMAMGQY